MKQKVAIGLSGGVDSAVAAKLLVESGYDVRAFYIEAYNEPGCRTDQDKKDALKVALKLMIPFEVVDLRDAYKKKVLEYFYDVYGKGCTPNPDVICNREIKFGLFYEHIKKLGFDKVATGHYARLTDIEGTILLQRARDTKKDQSYFLWQVESDRLVDVIFPLGEMTKKEVRQKAKEYGLEVSDKPDSMGICFVGEVDIRSVLAQRLPNKRGDVILNNRIVGWHDGIWTLTVGQKIGSQVILNPSLVKKAGIDTARMPHLFVVKKNVDTNEIVIGMREQCNLSKFVITNFKLNLSRDEIFSLVKGNKLFIRIRNLGEIVAICDLEMDGDQMRVVLSEEIFAPSPGQMAVLYARVGERYVQNAEVVVGGGEINY